MPRQFVRIFDICGKIVCSATKAHTNSMLNSNNPLGLRKFTPQIFNGFLLLLFSFQRHFIVLVLNWGLKTSFKSSGSNSIRSKYILMSKYVTRIYEWQKCDFWPLNVAAQKKITSFLHRNCILYFESVKMISSLLLVAVNIRYRIWTKA